MYGLPQSTEIKKQLPKKAIYAKFELKPSQRESFDADIARIDIVGVISTSTIPAVSIGEEIKEFYILAVQLKRKEYNNKNIALLSRLIPQKMVIALHYQNEVQLAVYCTRLVTSNWQPSEEVSIPLNGLNLDAVWDNIVALIGDITIAEGKSVSEQIAENDAYAKLMKQIEQLEKKTRTEKQPRKKLELFEKLKELKKKIR